MKNFAKMQKVLLGSVSAVAISAMVGPAFAQEAGVETVVVTGIRASLESAQSIKQNSDQVVDSITAVDIGALPDRSVAEALQRVPGVQITRTDANRDPVRWAGYGNGVFVRGLSWVQALTNGHGTFGADNGRTISFADISASLMAAVDVYKNPNAKMIEGGVGGTVDLRTRKPFDTDGQMIAFSAEDVYGDLSGKVAPAANALYSNRWNTHIGEIGILVSGDYQLLRTGDNVMQLDTFGRYTKTDGTPVQIPILGGVNGPNGNGYRHMDWWQERETAYTAVQWRPNEKVEIGLTGIYSKADPSSVEHTMTWLPPSDQASIDSYHYAADGTFLGGTINDAKSPGGGHDTRYGTHHHINMDLSANIKYTPTDRLSISADVQYTEARSAFYDMTLYDKMKNNSWCYYPAVGWAGPSACPATPTVGVDYWPNAPVINVTENYAGNTPSITYTGDVAAQAVKSNYIWGSAMDHVENNFAHNWNARADLSYDLAGTGLGSFVKSIEIGGRVDLREEVTRQSTWNWTELAFATYKQGWSWGVDGTVGPVVAATGDLTAGGAGATSLYTFPKMFGTPSVSVWLAKGDLLKKGGLAVWDAVKDAETPLNAIGIGGWWQPLMVKYGCTSGKDYYCNAIYTNTTPGSTAQTAGINSPTEDTYAGYFQTNFAHDTFLGLEVPIDGNIGVRIVQTRDTSGPGYFLLPAVTACTNPPAPATPTCTGHTDREVAYAFVGNSGSAVATATASRDHTYTDILPSFNFRAHLTDQIQARVAYSQQVVRPDFAFMQNYTTLSYGFSATDGNVFSGLGGQGGNPLLKPLHANNYDVSVEWYFAPTGNLSFAMFHKDITNYFATGTRPETYTRNGITETFNVQRYYNGDKGRVEGFELAYQQFYDSLPGAWSGIGLQANYTKIYNSGGTNPSWNITSAAGNSFAADRTLPLEGMSNDSYNIALMYEKYGISARAAYNWRSKFLMTTSAANLDQPVWQEKFGQLDASVMYTFLDHYKIGVQATNVLKAKTFLDVGPLSYHPRYEWVDVDRKLSVVVRASW